MAGDRDRGLAHGSRPPRRGDVYWVNLDPVVGNEIRKTRPAVIVSNDSCNRYGTRVVVLQITTNIDTLYPGEAMLEMNGKPARALGDQILSLDRTRLQARAGRLTADEMSRVDEALAVTLDLPISRAVHFPLASSIVHQNIAPGTAARSSAWRVTSRLLILGHRFPYSVKT